MYIRHKIVDSLNHQLFISIDTSLPEVPPVYVVESSNNVNESHCFDTFDKAYTYLINK